MAADAAQKAILYFVELLMNSKTPVSVTQLAGHFGDTCFTADMRLAAGVNEVGLHKLLAKYPSLFNINGNMVSLNTGGINTDQTADNSELQVRLPDVTAEMEAVQYFRSKLLKKRDRWVPIKSLAGHLSQASDNIRRIVGPQTEIDAWLHKHAYIFELSKENVRLQQDVLVDAADAGSVFSDHSSDSSSVADSDVLSINSLDDDIMGKDLLTTKVGNKLLLLLKDLVRTNGPLELDHISSQMIMHVPIDLLPVAPKVDFVELIRRHPNVFRVSDNKLVSLANKGRRRKRASSRQPTDDRVSLTAGEGVIYHLSKLWGIIDLGEHEHVFFDRSLLDAVDDLRTAFTVGQKVLFDAVLAAPSSRAKWKASRVWIEPLSTDDSLTATRPTDLDIIHFDIHNLLQSPDFDITPVAAATLSFHDISQSLQGIPTTTTFQSVGNIPVHSVQEMDADNIQQQSTSSNSKQCVDVACQTVSTGEIVPTKFYFTD